MQWVLLSATAIAASDSRAVEYEVSGRIRGTVIENGTTTVYSNEFAVYVRDCSWLIQTTEDIAGHRLIREVGSTNGTEICEFLLAVDATKKDDISKAFITPSSVPIDLLDKGMVGHLWLMFASRCYWGSQHSEWLPPVYDWHASIGANPNLRKRAEWVLLEGTNSLPREVRYLGEWDETNGLYRVIGTKVVAGMQIPTGFVFEERYAVRKGMVLRKRVEAEVSSVRGVCSRASLLPVLSTDKSMAIDWRLRRHATERVIPSYAIARSEKWPSIDEARALLAAAKTGDGASLRSQGNRVVVVDIVICLLVLGPVAILLFRKRFREHASTRSRVR